MKPPSASETHPEPGELFVLGAIRICGKEAAFGSVRDFTAAVFAACLPAWECLLSLTLTTSLSSLLIPRVFSSSHSC